MKRLLASFAALAIACTALTACGTKTEGGVKTGLAVISSIAKSTDASEKEGLGQVNSNVVAVTVDKDGKIVKCFIDAAQTNINFSTEGKITTDPAKEFKTKNELGTEYGMGKNSSIGKEWNEQAAALAKYVEGKTLSEVKGIALKDGYPTGADLVSSVTFNIADVIATIEKAVKNAKDLGADAGDKLGLGIVTNIAKSKDAGDATGLAQAYSTYAAVTFGTDGKITSCAIDASQGNIEFSAEGKITSDLSIPPETKQERGDGYGMKKASSIGKEWYEQANAFASYVIGKTTDSINGITLDEKSVPTGADLTSSVTVSVGDFIEIIDKANTNAK